jgi:uncharacterized protein (TIGR02996 family)
VESRKPILPCQTKFRELTSDQHGLHDPVLRLGRSQSVSEASGASRKLFLAKKPPENDAHRKRPGDCQMAWLRWGRVRGTSSEQPFRQRAMRQEQLGMAFDYQTKKVRPAINESQPVWYSGILGRMAWFAKRRVAVMKRMELHAPGCHRFINFVSGNKTLSMERGEIGGESCSALIPEYASPSERSVDSWVERFGRRGYKVVDQPSKNSEPIPELPRNLALEHQLLADPDNLETYLVYSDWLQSNNHPQGELIALMVREAKLGGNKQLEQAIAAYLQEHGPAILGGIQEYAIQFDENERPAFGWKLGFLSKLHLFLNGYQPPNDELYKLEPILKEILTHPVSILLNDITFGLNGGGGNYEQLLEILRHHPPRYLQRLEIARFIYPEESEMSWVELGDLSQIWSTIPSLSWVELQGGSMVLGESIHAENMKHFEIRTGGLSATNVDAIANSKWPQLETLILWLGNPDYGGDSTIYNLRPIVNSKNFPNLKKLGLMNCDYADDICRILPNCSLLPQLTELDLSMGTMSDEGARILLDHRAKFSHLSVLNVEDNYLHSTVAELGSQSNTKVSAQRSVSMYNNTEYRFTSVGE